jgi:hypothetical protein
MAYATYAIWPIAPDITLNFLSAASGALEAKPPQHCKIWALFRLPIL